MSLTVGSDIGPRCSCEGTIYRYTVDHFATECMEPRSDVMAVCVSCLSGLRFETKGHLTTAADVRARHNNVMRQIGHAERVSL